MKGRPDESQYEDHVLRGASYRLQTPDGEQEAPMLNALNEETYRPPLNMTTLFGEDPVGHQSDHDGAVAVEEHRPLQAGHLIPDLHDLPQLLEIGDEDQTDLRVVQDVGDLVGGERVVDGDVGDPRAQRRPVRLGPFRPVLGEDRHPLPALDSEGGQAEGGAAHPVEEIPVGDRLPVAGPHAAAQRIGAVEALDGLEEQLHQRARRQVRGIGGVLAGRLRNRRHGRLSVGCRFQSVSIRMATSRSGLRVCRTLQYLSRERSTARSSLSISDAATPEARKSRRSAV